MKSISITPANGLQRKPTHEQIAVAAYHLYVENGRRDGHDLDDWLRMEKLLTQKLEEMTNAGISEANRKPGRQTIEVRPQDNHEQSRTDQAPARRMEIRQKTQQYRPGSRQPQGNSKRITQSAGAA